MTINHISSDTRQSILWQPPVILSTIAHHSSHNFMSSHWKRPVISSEPDSLTVRRYGWPIATSKDRRRQHSVLSSIQGPTKMPYSWEHGLISWRKSRAISSARLWRHRLYTCALSTSSSATTLYGVLILRRASRLDAFSAYPDQTQIPGGAPGGTTGKPEVCPSRSSRTSDGSTQNSCAHDR